mgnify:CR=1 FL=1
MDIVSSSTDILQAAADSATAPVGLAPVAGEKRTHDQVTSGDGATITNGANNDTMWATNKKVCVSSSDEQLTGESVHTPTSAAPLPTNRISEVSEWNEARKSSSLLTDDYTFHNWKLLLKSLMHFIFYFLHPSRSQNHWCITTRILLALLTYCSSTTTFVLHVLYYSLSLISSDQ